MQKHRQLTFWNLLLVVLFGFGCTGVAVSDLTPEQAAASLDLAIGSEIVLRPTVLGLGGKIVDLFGGDADERSIAITEWTPGSSVSLTWSITTETETAASIAAREAYESEYGQTAVGEEVPDAPEPEVEETIQSGSRRSESLANATTLELPELWNEGDAGTAEASLIWIGKAQYDELVSTRSTTLSLGLFDESLMQAQEVASSVTSFLDSIKNILPLAKGESEGVRGHGQLM